MSRRNKTKLRKRRPKDPLQLLLRAPFSSCCLSKPQTADTDDSEDEVEDTDHENDGAISTNIDPRDFFLRVRPVTMDPTPVDTVRPVTMDPTPVDTTTKQYIKCTMGQACQWPVYVEPNWHGGNDQLRHCLERDLDLALSKYLPLHCVQALRKANTPIWINRTLQYGPKCSPIRAQGACFHPGSDWLQENGMHTEKCQAVELYCAQYYQTNRHLWGPCGLWVHEFSHAYHYKCLPNGYDNQRIIDCYKAAMKEGLYDCVPVKGVQGPTAKAYACTNAMEYFAELSTAFLGGISNNNDNNKDGDDDDNGEEKTSSNKEDNDCAKFNKCSTANNCGNMIHEHMHCSKNCGKSKLLNNDHSVFKMLLHTVSCF